jgi:exosortase/archaeosortase family protein
VREKRRGHADAQSGGARRAVPHPARPPAGDRRAAIAFLLRLLAGWALAAGLLSLLPGIEGWAVSSTVASVRWTLHLASLEPVISGQTISLGPVGLRIVPECTPLMPILMLVIAVIAYPSTRAWKVAGVIAGAGALWLYNVVRMLALIATMAWWPSSFKFVHVYLWQTVTLIVVCALFMLWLRLGRARERAA